MQEKIKLQQIQDAEAKRQAEAKAARIRAAIDAEQRTQQKLRNLGVCENGFRWVKVSGGYKCTGGKHFVADWKLR